MITRIDFCKVTYRGNKILSMLLEYSIWFVRLDSIFQLLHKLNVKAKEHAREHGTAAFLFYNDYSFIPFMKNTKGISNCILKITSIISFLIKGRIIEDMWMNYARRALYMQLLFTRNCRVLSCSTYISCEFRLVFK